ncbi:MAG TPA: hypothetical protein VIZ22_04370 [Candidatus Limnocylindrales bacterium]
MNPTNDIDRVLEAWFWADAPVGAPSDLVAAIAAATTTTRRRPGWLVPDRWMPGPRHSTTMLRYALLAGAALLVAITAVLIVGSRPAVPPPFGPARPGVFALSIDGDIVTTAQDGSERAMLTTGDAWDYNPMFSRDGTKLAFWSRPAGSSASDLVVIGNDGSGRRTVAREEFGGWCAPTSAGIFPGCYGPGAGATVSWSPDGSSLAYSNTAGNQAQIFIARTDSFGSTPIGDASLKGQNPSWSPDGSTIAFSGGAYDDERGVYLMRADGTSVRRLTKGPGATGAFTAAWSPDGRRLVFPGSNGYSTLFVINIDGSDERQIDSGSFVGGASWSPDGQRLAWLHSDANLDHPAAIVIADDDGSNPRSYPNAGIPRHGLAYDAFSLCVGWSVDGKQVVGILTSDGIVADRLLQIDPDNGKTVILDTPGLRAWNQQRLAP